MSKAHDNWQDEARDEYVRRDKKVFTLAASPGAGKTVGAGKIAKILLNNRTVVRVSIAVPTDYVKTQWARSLSPLGIELIPYDPSVDEVSGEFQGRVQTYAALAKADKSIPAISERRATREPTFVILDEPHHLGHNQSWGEGVAYAYEHANKVLLITGTPWRRPLMGKIAFAEYDKDSRIVLDYEYSYGRAYIDGVCRGISFPAFDADIHYVDAGQIVESALTDMDVNSDEIGLLLNAIYNPKHRWVREIFNRANATLSELRQEVPNAGGLILADSTRWADDYKSIMEEICREQVTVVHSDIPGAKDLIDTYRKALSRWIIAVGMISEGVDIPRLAVGAYLSTIRTELFFQQIMGRLIRRTPGDSHQAVLYIPAIKALLQYAHRVLKMMAHAWEEREKKNGNGGGGGDPRVREILSVSDPEHVSTVFDEQEFEPTEIQQAESFCRDHGLPLHQVATVAKVLRQNLGTTRNASNNPATVNERPQFEKRALLEGECENLQRRLCMLLREKSGNIADSSIFEKMQKRLIRIFDGKRKSLKAAKLLEQKALLERCIAEQRWP